MIHFYLNKNEQGNGDHEVHRGTCSRLPDINNREYLGFFNTSSEAIAQARAMHPFWRIDGCYYCCPENHKS